MRAQVEQKKLIDADKSLQTVEEILADKIINDDGSAKKHIDKFIYVLGFLGAGFTIFSIPNIWGAAAPIVPFFTWAGYLAVATMWFTYGLIQKEKAIIISYAFWMVASMMVFAGLFFYA